DSTEADFSVAGQRPTANAITLDGLSLGSGSVPQDAIRSTRVVTSSYDAARGQFSGGLVASTTRSGKNIPQGSFTYTLRDRALAQVPGLADERTTENTVAFLRFDWKVSEAQTLTLRLDGRWDSQQPTRVSPLGLPPTGGTRTERGGGVMASLTSHFAGSLINE